MNGFGAAFTIVSAIAMLCLSRRHAVVVLLLSAAYMSAGEVLDIGGANFTIPRILVAVGFLRVVLRGESLDGGLRFVDGLMLLWGTLLVGTSAFHTTDAWIYRLGLIWSELGGYFLMRIWLRDLADVRRVFRTLSIALIPLAALLVAEKFTGVNLFSVLSKVSEAAAVRHGHVRASGPFSHAILAGTVGAMCFGMGLALWKSSRPYALLGCAVGAAMIFASTSSGPLLMAALIGVGVGFWVLRNHMALVRWTIVGGLLALNAVMNDPVYFLVARIDLVGGSQGYFRAQLIRSSIEHLSEWWLAGTDYTRHWMPTGIAASSRHTDMTNHVLSMGVTGGLPLMLTFVLILAATFRNVGTALRFSAQAPVEERLFVWALGSTLFGFIMNFLSITLFDQTVTFFWLVIAAITSVAASSARHASSAEAGKSAAPDAGTVRSPHALEFA